MKPRAVHRRGLDGNPACGLSLTRWGSMDVTTTSNPHGTTCRRPACLQPHMVWLPGPITGRPVDIKLHPDGCHQDACRVRAAIEAWLARPDCYIAVEGDYWTRDGRNYWRV